MLPRFRQISLLVGVTLQACSLAGCGTINEKVAAGVSDVIPAWAGGLPADAPPRPKEAGSYLPVHDMPPEREAAMKPDEQKRIQSELIAARDRQASTGTPSQNPPAR